MVAKQQTGLAGVEGYFTQPEERQPENTEKGRGEPQQTSMLLYDDQTLWLEEVLTDIRRGGGKKKIRKASIIRVLLDIGMGATPNLKEVTSEEDLKERFEAALKQV